MGRYRRRYGPQAEEIREQFMAAAAAERVREFGAQGARNLAEAFHPDNRDEDRRG